MVEALEYNYTKSEYVEGVASCYYVIGCFQNILILLYDVVVIKNLFSVLNGKKSVFPYFIKYEKQKGEYLSEEKNALQTPISFVVEHGVVVAYWEEFNHHIDVKHTGYYTSWIEGDETIFHFLLESLGLFIIWKHDETPTSNQDGAQD